MNNTQSIREQVRELSTLGMNANQAFEELTKRGVKAKKSTVAYYYSTRDNGSKKASSKRASAKVTKTGATKTLARPVNGSTRVTRTDIIDWVYNSDLGASKKREIANLILN